MSFEFSTSGETSALTSLLQAEDTNVLNNNLKSNNQEHSKPSEITEEIKPVSLIEPTIPAQITPGCSYCRSFNTARQEITNRQPERSDVMDRSLNPLHSEGTVLFPHLQLGQGKRKRSNHSKKGKANSKNRKRSTAPKKRVSKKSTKKNKKKVKRAGKSKK